ncbi:uncharacterized protein LOC129728239 [Wyeomyia smithii]|uniref:uncharacterized protein LOC129728239 n=1 Tax=Wyeomyia smithii TaxID=174621 RepID=UPI002467C77A|nr:uncharacterized protein LOC129728239 [Wyeomyia smithii]
MSFSTLYVRRHRYLTATGSFRWINPNGTNLIGGQVSTLPALNKPVDRIYSHRSELLGMQPYRVLFFSAYFLTVLAGICQEVFKNSVDDRPFFRIVESKSLEIFYPKRDRKHKVFGIEIYKNPKATLEEAPCDLCVYTTRVKDGCFIIKSFLLAVRLRDILKVVILVKFIGDIEMRKIRTEVVKFTDYIIPPECVCRDVSSEYCSRASRNMTEYRPVFKLHTTKGTSAYLPKAKWIDSLELEVFNYGTNQTGEADRSSLSVTSIMNRCMIFETNESQARFSLLDYIAFAVFAIKINGNEIVVEPRQIHLRGD